MSKDTFPVGAVISHGGVLAEGSYWMLCNGDVLSEGAYPELFDVIGRTYGGDEALKEFRLPDYQGVFLRGADAVQGKSPKATRDRISLHPTGNVVASGLGTLQLYATKRPNGDTFRADFAHLPTGSKGTHGVTKDNNTAKQDSRAQNTCTSGGDAESRPRNVYVNFYIKVRA